MPALLRLLHGCCIASALCLATAVALAAPTSPVGTWLTFDDDGHESGKVEIVEQGGLLYGRIVGIDDSAKRAGRCDKCGDDRHGQPAMGLQILRGMRADGERWDGGEILDPETGSTYRCTMRVSEDGARLVVRGFIGVSLFGRSQTWRRLE